MILRKTELFHREKKIPDSLLIFMLFTYEKCHLPFNRKWIRFSGHFAIFYLMCVCFFLFLSFVRVFFPKNYSNMRHLFLQIQVELYDVRVWVSVFCVNQFLFWNSMYVLYLILCRCLQTSKFLYEKNDIQRHVFLSMCELQ